MMKGNKRVRKEKSKKKTKSKKQSISKNKWGVPAGCNDWKREPGSVRLTNHTYLIIPLIVVIVVISFVAVAATASVFNPAAHIPAAAAVG